MHPKVNHKLISNNQYKNVSFSWELMFTRSSFQTADMIEQHHILNRVAALLDEGILQSTHSDTLQGLTADNLKQAHARLESGRTIGKLVIKY
jgi:NADPH2:quinone reductase